MRTVEIRALSFKEPFASLMLNGKTLETRTWDTQYRGIVLICASKKFYNKHEVLLIAGKKQLNRIQKNIRAKIKAGRAHFDKFGYAIAIGDMVNSRLMKPGDEDKAFVRYVEGLYVHEYKNVIPIEPFLWKGTQRWKVLTEEQKKLIIIKK